MLSPTANYIARAIKTAIEAQFYAERCDIWRPVTPILAAKPSDKLWTRIAQTRPFRRVRSVEGHTGSDVLGTTTQDLVITLDTFWFGEREDVEVGDWFRDGSVEDDGTLSNSHGLWFVARGDPKLFSDFGITLAGHVEITASGGSPPAALLLAYPEPPPTPQPPGEGGEVPSGTLYTGTTTATTSAVAVTGNLPCVEVLVQADPDNTVDVFVGNVSSQPVQLLPGASQAFAVLNANLVYVRTASGTALVNWLARD